MHVRFGPEATGKGPANGGHLASGLPVLAASERAGGDLAIKVVCRFPNGCPVIEVWDGSDELPEMRHPALGDLDGRGLPLVAALSGGWTVEKMPGKGKIVRVELGGAA